jgi:hypothetical protein
MRLKVLALIAIVHSCLTVNAQVAFQKTFGDTGNDNAVCVIQTHEGGFVAAGYVADIVSSASGVYLIKIKSNGDTLWTRTFSDTTGSFSAYSIIETKDHGFVISALTSGFGAGGNDVFLIRTDSVGNLIWSKTFGGTGVDFGTSVFETTDGKFILTGYTQLGTGLNDIYLVKTDSAGDLIWSKTFGTSVNENARAVLQDLNGDYVIGGYTSGDPFILKTDTSGNLIWAKTYTGSGTDFVYSLNLTADSGYIMSGQTTNPGAGQDELFMAKADINGNIEWAKAYGGSNTDDGQTSASQTNDGGYVLCGSSKSFSGGVTYDAYLIKTDSTGNLLWSKTFGAVGYDDHAYSVIQAFDKGFVLAGSSSGFSGGSYDVYLIKTDSAGYSGCNENVPATIVTPFTLTDASIHLTVTNPATITTTPITISGGGGSEITLCSSLINRLPHINGFVNDFKIFPNPSQGLMHISFNLSQSENISLKIFSPDGKLILTPLQKTFASGENDYYLDITGIDNGLYFIKTEAADFQFTERIFLIK